jgi:Mitochondrial carrier protein
MDNELTSAQKYPVHFIAGGTALATAFAVMHPLDTLKTQLQASGVKSINLTLLKSLGRGFAASVIGAFPQVYCAKQREL